MEDPKIANPETFTLACGCKVPNVPGTQAWNYYDGCVVELTKVSALNIQADTSGKLPNGVTYWIFGNVDNSRVVCLDCRNF